MTRTVLFKNNNKTQMEQNTLDRANRIMSLYWSLDFLQFIKDEGGEHATGERAAKTYKAIQGIWKDPHASIEFKAFLMREMKRLKEEFDNL